LDIRLSKTGHYCALRRRAWKVAAAADNIFSVMESEMRRALRQLRSMAGLVASDISNLRSRDLTNVENGSFAPLPLVTVVAHLSPTHKRNRAMVTP
jgi:hypothetical protein